MNDPAGPTRALSRPDLFATGRLAVFTSLGTISGALLLPYVPTNLQRRVRGALVHDVASRHGLSLTADARAALAEPTVESSSASKWLGGALGFAARRALRRVGPLAFIAPVRAGFEVFALGVLFERYVETVRRGPSVRIHAAEARALREALDRATLRVFSPKLEPARAPASPSVAEDLRDDATRFIDTMLLTGADLPGYLVRRLEGAFDEIVAEHPELVGG